MTNYSDDILLNMGYPSICHEYRVNPNPVVKCGWIVGQYYVSKRFWSINRYTILDMLEEVFGEFYHIDPTSIFITQDPRWYAEVIGFKAKSLIKPYAEEYEEYKTECLEYWISTLQPST